MLQKEVILVGLFLIHTLQIVSEQWVNIKACLSYIYKLRNILKMIQNWLLIISGDKNITNTKFVYALTLGVQDYFKSIHNKINISNTLDRLKIEKKLIRHIIKKQKKNKVKTIKKSIELFGIKIEEKIKVLQQRLIES